MATRLIGTDDSDPRLPDDVIAATVGTAAGDLAAGTTLASANAYTDAAVADLEPGGGGGESPFVGAYSTAMVPAASTITPGYYYWDTDQAAPFWSDGAIWRTAGAVTGPPPDLGLEVTFTMHEDATTFEPWIVLVAGASGTVQWVNSDDEVIATGTTPSITTIPDDFEITMRVVSGVALVMSEVEIINIGFDHTQDNGPETPDGIYDHPPQQVTGISTLANLANLKYFMAANTPLTGTVNFTGLSKLVAIECYNSDVEEVLFTGTVINRLCVERCRITDLDLTPVAETIRDLRCAVGQGGPVTFHTDETLQVLWHYCTRDQVVTEHIPMSQMPALIQWWVWNTGITTMDVPASPVLDSIDCKDNLVTSATLDAWLIALAGGTHSGGYLNMVNASPPTAASATARSTLLARGWVLVIPVASGGDPGWTYAAPTQVDWVLANLTGLSTTPTVTSGDLSFTSNAYARVIQRPATRNAGDVYFEVTVDRTEIDGSVGTDFWAIVANTSVTGANGLRCMIRWPQVNPTDATGVAFGPSATNSGSAGTAVRINPTPAGWTTAGAHKVGLLHQGATGTIILDGVKVWQCSSTIIDGYAGGGYVGLGGDTDNNARISQTWGLTEV